MDNERDWFRYHLGSLPEQLHYDYLHDPEFKAWLDQKMWRLAHYDHHSEDAVLPESEYPMPSTWRPARQRRDPGAGMTFDEFEARYLPDDYRRRILREGTPEQIADLLVGPEASGDQPPDA